MKEELTPIALSLEPGAPAFPPPPPAVDPHPSGVQTKLLVGGLVAGVLLVAIGFVHFPYHELLQRGGYFLATYALLVATSWLPPSVLSARVDRTLDKWVRNSSGGYYGVMALSVFAQLELAGLLDAIASFEFSISELVPVVIKTLIGFSIDSIMNLAWGMGWPGKVIQHGVWPAGILVGATWLVFRGGREVLPHATFAQNSKSKPASNKRS